MRPKILLALFLIYLIWPMDLVRDFPWVGFIDDLLVGLFLYQQYRKSQRPAATDENSGEKPSEGSSKVPEEDNSTPWNPYECLGISPGATKEEIKRAYREQVAQYHPDKVAHLGEELQKLAHQRTLDLQRAFEELS